MAKPKTAARGPKVAFQPGRMLGANGPLSRTGCPFCESPRHHEALIPMPPTAAEVLTDALVTDAITHAVLAAYEVLRDQDVPQDRWIDLLGPVAHAIAWAVGAGEAFGRRNALEGLFDELIAEKGEGTYALDIRRAPEHRA